MKVNVLLIEDSPYDAKLVLKELEQGGYEPEYKVVSTAPEMRAALGENHWDIILSDYSMPKFSGPDALKLLKETGLDIPMIIISGTVGEEFAVDSLRAGAKDFISKGHYVRLIPAIQRELAEKAAREELREMEKKFHQSEEKYRSLVEGIKDYAIFMLDPNGVINSWNEGAARMKGYEAEEAIGQHFSMLYLPEDRERGLPQRNLSIATAEGQFRQEWWRQRKDGSRFWADVVITPMYDENHHLTGFSKVVKDRTFQKQAQEELEAAKAQAESANKKKSEFLANMSHELRTPLNAVIGYSDMLKKGLAGPLNEKQEQYIAKVSSSGRHLLDIVNDILEVSQLESRKIVLNPHYVPLAPLLDGLVKSMEEQAAKKKVSLALEARALVEGIYADPDRLRQIFTNLISNAIKFNKENGKVHIRLSSSEDENWLICEISDTGIGIPKESLDELFTHFYQVDSSTTRFYEGTGLGLALTKQLVELHGGAIEAVSEEGVGSTFTFRLPVGTGKQE